MNYCHACYCTGRCRQPPYTCDGQEPIPKFYQWEFAKWIHSQEQTIPLIDKKILDKIITGIDDESNIIRGND